MEVPRVASERGVLLSLPAAAPDPISPVVAVEIEGVPAVIPPAKPVSQGRPVTVSAEWAGWATLQKEHINDGRFNTIWAGPENSRAGWAQLDLGVDHSVNRAVLSEGPDYARCNKFTFQAQIDGQWKTVVSGAGIGPKKELQFEPVKARHYRLNMTVDKPAGEPDAEPVIAEFQVFDQKENYRLSISQAVAKRPYALKKQVLNDTRKRKLPAGNRCPPSRSSFGYPAAIPQHPRQVKRAFIEIALGPL